MFNHEVQTMNQAILVLVLLSLLHCSCSQIESVGNKEESSRKFQVRLVETQTKTVNDGYHTYYNEGNSISLFHSQTGTDSYVSDKAFTISDVNANVFTGELSEELNPAAAYDWYAYCPSGNIISPAAGHQFRQIIGAKNNCLVQKGNDSMGHLCGIYFPVAGSVRNVPGGEFPTIPMTNVMSVIAFEITNESGAEAVVKAIDFTSPSGIVGMANVAFDDGIKILEAPASKFCELSVTDGAQIGIGKSAKFYMGICPQVFEPGTELIVHINTSCGRQKLVKPLTESLELKSGRIKAFKVSLTAPGEALTTTRSDFYSLNLGQIEGFTNTAETEYFSFDGWVLKNGAPQTNWPGSTSNVVPVINGKKDFPGTLKSPVFSGGCGHLSFSYGLNTDPVFQDQMSFRIDVKRDGETVWTTTITDLNAVGLVQLQFDEDINVSGDFTIEFTNLCPQGKTWPESDSVAIFDISWTNYAE